MNFIFFGDSICFGQFVSLPKVWVSRLSEKIEGLKGYAVINTSISGNTSRMALERMGYDVQSMHIKAIYIQFGMNDCNYWLTDSCLPRVSRHAFKANLKEIIHRAKVFGAEKIFLGTNHPSTKTEAFSHFSEISYQESSTQYNRIIREVANEELVILVDNEKEWFNRIKNGVHLQDLLLPDKIHLNEAGHEVYYNYISPIIIENL